MSETKIGPHPNVERLIKKGYKPFYAFSYHPDALKAASALRKEVKNTPDSCVVSVRTVRTDNHSIIMIKAVD